MLQAGRILLEEWRYHEEYSDKEKKTSKKEEREAGMSGGREGRPMRLLCPCSAIAASTATTVVVAAGN